MALEIEKKTEVINRIFELNESNKKNKYKYIIPFDPNRFGLFLMTESLYFPISQLIFDLESVKEETALCLRHFDVFKQGVQYGEGIILDDKIRIASKESNNGITFLVRVFK